MIVCELVVIGCYLWYGVLGCFGVVDCEKVEEVILLVGLKLLVYWLVDSFFGGERQWVWIVMLVVQDSCCLLFDELILVLDIVYQVDVLLLVYCLSQECGLMVIVVLYDINMVVCYCDYLVVLCGGEMIVQGMFVEIMCGEIFEMIYGILMGILLYLVGVVFVSFVY